MCEILRPSAIQRVDSNGTDHFDFSKKSTVIICEVFYWLTKFKIKAFSTSSFSKYVASPSPSILTEFTRHPHLNPKRNLQNELTTIIINTKRRYKLTRAILFFLNWAQAYFLNEKFSFVLAIILFVWY